ncbi:2-aminoadipate aminotransferase [Pandoraea terrae]|uniref:2-aminoadipate aminotransferase n=1 Tax=Pandoraea terrae TaxID=1537710 RepID=A0A5E4YI36_9BURK|nr:PLP-dependent aminotransferase family protein [Pandoraea terrae]VVE48371.1 2-aminoadipate aminotransferase [Pandoraea terrae]
MMQAVADFPFTAPFAAPQGSAIRELFKHLATPGMISFAGGYPSPDLFDRDGLAAAAAEAWQGAAGECLQYGPTEGLPALREALAARMRAHGAQADPAQVLVTTGSQQAFDLLVRVLVAPGDTVVVERPTYSAALQALRLAQANVLSVGMDGDGLDVEALASLLAAQPAERRPKLIYTVPTFANPSGATLTLARRRRLLEIVAEYGVLLVEDDPYGELRFSGEPVPTLAALAKGVPGAEPWVVYLGSLSKVLAPGLRLGWMHGAAPLLRRCVIAKQTVDLCTPPWLQAVAASYLRQGRLDAQIVRIADAYRARATTLCTALRARLGGRFDFTEPQGGMFVWGRWRDGTDATALLNTAIEEKVMYVPGAPFFSEQSDRAALRLCFTMSTPVEIETGVGRLAQAAARHAAA